jgi:hypothetical protein
MDEVALGFSFIGGGLSVLVPALLILIVTKIAAMRDGSLRRR